MHLFWRERFSNQGSFRLPSLVRPSMATTRQPNPEHHPRELGSQLGLVRQNVQHMELQEAEVATYAPVSRRGH
jgi:hypothetical protein